MINSDFCYSKFDTQASAIIKYFENNKDSLVYNDYYGFKVADVPKETWLQEPVLKNVNDIFKIDGCGIIKLEPYRCYKWHQDAQRGVSINLLLTPEIHSYTLFGNSSQDSEDQFDIVSLSYEPNSFYLFNNQAMHTIVNFDQPRYLFTTEFVATKDVLSYRDLFTWKELVNDVDGL